MHKDMRRCTCHTGMEVHMSHKDGGAHVSQGWMEVHMSHKDGGAHVSQGWGCTCPARAACGWRGASAHLVEVVRQVCGRQHQHMRVVGAHALHQTQQQQHRWCVRLRARSGNSTSDVRPGWGGQQHLPCTNPRPSTQQVCTCCTCKTPNCPPLLYPPFPPGSLP